MSELHYNPADRCWVLDGFPEIYIYGDPLVPPTQTILDFAAHIAAQIDVVTQKAIWFINGFIDTSKWPEDQWGVIALEFGMPGSEPELEFRAILLNDVDKYFDWTVSMAEMSVIGISPDAFSVQSS
jgi:hypothetical protein